MEDKAMINKDMFNEVLDTFYLTKVVSVKATGESKESKTVTLKVKYEGVSINDLALATLGQGVVVQWQNGGSGRKNYDNLPDKGIVKVDFKSPGKSPEKDPDSVVIARLASFKTQAEREAYLREQLAKFES